ncbi:MAG: hypothetical protein AAF512_02060 [Pseudomonadota bacterium]
MSAIEYESHDLSANTNTKVKGGTTGKISTVSVVFCNRNASDIKVRLASIDDSDIANVADGDYMLYDVTVKANDSLPWTGILLKAGHSLMARADSANVSVPVTALTEDE